MATQSISDAVAEMVAALETNVAAVIPGLQVNGYFNPQASPPTIDIYADTPFQEGAGFNVQSKLLRWVVRARVSNADPQAAATTLYRLLDVTDPASVEVALAGINVVVPDDGSVDGFATFADDNAGDLIGARWRVAAYL